MFSWDPPFSCKLIFPFLEHLLVLLFTFVSSVVKFFFSRLPDPAFKSNPVLSLTFITSFLCSLAFYFVKMDIFSFSFFVFALLVASVQCGCLSRFEVECVCVCVWLGPSNNVQLAA